jgi:hypothetical protein
MFIPSTLSITHYSSDAIATTTKCYSHINWDHARELFGMPLISPISSIVWMIVQTT